MLSKSQKDSFEKYAEDVRKHNFEAFNDFLKSFEKNCLNLQNTLHEVYRQTDSMISEALKLTEKSVPTSNASLLSAFGNAQDANYFEQKHVDLLLGLSKIISDLNIPLNACAKIITDASDGILVELKLRNVALNEYSHYTELCQKYSALTNNCEKFSREAIIIHASKYSKLIQLLVSETANFCQNADAAIENIKTNQTLYSRTAREYISRIHGISLKLREIQGDTNVKI